MPAAVPPAWGVEDTQGFTDVTNSEQQSSPIVLLRKETAICRVTATFDPAPVAQLRIFVYKMTDNGAIIPDVANLPLLLDNVAPPATNTISFTVGKCAQFVVGFIAVTAVEDIQVTLGYSLDGGIEPA